MSTLYSNNSTSPTEVLPVKPKPSVWDKKYIIENLPPWVYQDNPEPKSVSECSATICRLEHTIEDIELQIKIREFELETGIGRQQSKHEHDKWVVQALRAKQTYKYLLSAYKYWLITNQTDFEKKSSTYNFAKLLCSSFMELCELLKTEPPDFEDQLDSIKKEIMLFTDGLEVN